MAAADSGPPRHKSASSAPLLRVLQGYDEPKSAEDKDSPDSRILRCEEGIQRRYAGIEEVLTTEVHVSDRDGDEREQEQDRGVYHPRPQELSTPISDKAQDDRAQGPDGRQIHDEIHHLSTRCAEAA